MDAAARRGAVLRVRRSCARRCSTLLGSLDWSTFSVRLEHKEKLASLKQTLKAVDHAKLLRGVRAARSALQYHLGGWTGRDMLPLLLYEMARVAATPVAPPPGAPVVALYNDVETARDYDVGMHDVASQKAHAIVTRAGVQHGPDVWDCRSDDGYMCACKRRLPGAAPPLSLPAPARGPPKAVLPAAAVSAAAPAAPVPPSSCPCRPTSRTRRRWTRCLRLVRRRSATW